MQSMIDTASTTGRFCGVSLTNPGSKAVPTAFRSHGVILYLYNNIERLLISIRSLIYAHQKGYVPSWLTYA